MTRPLKTRLKEGLYLAFAATAIAGAIKAKEVRKAEAAAAAAEMPRKESPGLIHDLKEAIKFFRTP